MAWCVLTGLCEWWADEGIRDIGRARFHRARGAQGSGAPRPPGTVDRSRVAFVARRDPWRLAQLQIGPSAAGPTVVAWADEATVLLSGSPAEARILGPRQSYGDLALRRMLHPAPLETLVPRPWSSRLRIDGELLERDHSVLPELLSLAADFYRSTYDADLDVLTGWTAYIDGEAANRILLSHLTDVGP
jgi:hypothetical protein